MIMMRIDDDDHFDNYSKSDDAYDVDNAVE